MSSFWPLFVRGFCVSSGEFCTCNMMQEPYFVSLTTFQLEIVFLASISDLVKIEK